MFDPSTMLVIAATFLIAGMVKGVIGLGLPTISLALLTVAIDMPSAMALLLVPSFITNLWQASVGGNARLILRRLWPFLLMATVMVWIGAFALTRVDPGFLSALLGTLLVVYSVVSLAGYHLAISAPQEIWLGPLLGSINGVLTGMTGSFVVPGAMYLQALGLRRDVLVQAMGILFTASTMSLALALQGNHLLNVDLAMLSVAALLPATIGMVFGQRIRKTLSERKFRHVFFISLLVLGLYIVANTSGI